MFPTIDLTKVVKWIIKDYCHKLQSTTGTNFKPLALRLVSLLWLLRHFWSSRTVLLFHRNNRKVGRNAQKSKSKAVNTLIHLSVSNTHTDNEALFTSLCFLWSLANLSKSSLFLWNFKAFNKISILFSSLQFLMWVNWIELQCSS